MARCTNCNEGLPFTKVGLMSKRNNTVECKKCHAVFEGDQKQLGVIGGIGGGVGGLLGFLTVYAFLNNSVFALPLLLGTVSSVLICAIIQNKMIKLKAK